MGEFTIWNWPLHGRWKASKGFLHVNDVAVEELSNFLDYYDDSQLNTQRLIGIFK